MLDIKNKISYGTFNEVCESILNKKKTDDQDFK